MEVNSTNITISVKKFIEQLLLASNGTSGWLGKNRALAGIHSHGKIQKSRPRGYEKEVALRYSYTVKDFTLTLTGRVDGIFSTENPIVVEEIKSTTMSLKHCTFTSNNQHCAQVKLYALMYAKTYKISVITAQLTYYHIKNKRIKELSETFTQKELQDFFCRLVSLYRALIIQQKRWAAIRTKSISFFSFPFDVYRKGQRNYAISVYRAIEQEKILFAQAPTGIGKTVGTLFPAIKAMGEGFVTKIFFLTAKTVGREVAEKTLCTLRKWGLRLKSVTLTAKEKICFNTECNCDGAVCDYAKKYFETISVIMKIAEQYDFFDRERIETLAKQYNVCPFELSLDVSLFADCIIGDYNYIFDPHVYIKRYFNKKIEPYVLLIDESHNLPDRARDMFSASVEKKEIMSLKRKIKNEKLPFTKDLHSIQTYLNRKKKEIKLGTETFLLENRLPNNLILMLKSFLHNADIWLEKNISTNYRKDVMQVYFKINTYVKTTEYFDENYISYFEQGDAGTIKVKLFCNDPSKMLLNTLQQCKSTIFFSATLVPIPYFQRMLIRNNKSSQIQLPSPFPEKNFSVFVHTAISTKFSHREKSYEKIAELIFHVYKGKPGNYLIYFPSYVYMNRVYDIFRKKYTSLTSVIQKKGMSEEEKSAFLNLFKEYKRNHFCAFALLGGIFGEGIDLQGETLLGVIVVGVGLPQIGLERNLIMNFFSLNNENGFSYSYQLPGFNRVMQAAGRVIRSESDRGIAVLIDSRFSEYRYTSIFPSEWKNVTMFQTKNELDHLLNRFWG